MGLTEFLASYITVFIAKTGYASVFILMTMESMIFPIPSEAVMPFAGFLAFTKEFSFQGIIFFSTLGSLVGSLLSYFIGYYGGTPFLKNYGKYFLINNHDMEVTNNFFKKYGSITIFLSRFIPVIRHLISLPAGLAKMNLFKFSIYTIVGAMLWNSFLAVVGYFCKENWNSVMKYSEVIDILVIILIVVALIYFIYSHLKAWKKSNIKI